MKDKLRVMAKAMKANAHIRHMLNRILVLILILVIGIGVGVCIAKPWMKEEPEPIITKVEEVIAEENYTLSIGTVEEVLSPASDLITAKYYYTDADTYENYKELFGKKVPFTTDKVVFTYDGVISIGIELADVEYQIDNENQKITIKLPELTVKANEINEDSFEFPYISDSIFNATEMVDYVDLIGTLEKEKEKDLLVNTEFMEGALENTKTVLESFLTANDATKNYEVVFEELK